MIKTSEISRLVEQFSYKREKSNLFSAAIRSTRMPMIITDPRQADNPIVFVNDAFLKLTGYERDEVMAGNCRFLQGPDTDPRTVGRIRDALSTGREVNVDILNYRKDGTPFWNALDISPVRTDAGELQYFFALQYDVTERKDALAVKTALLHEVDHRVKNNLQMVTALINLQARTISDHQVRESLQTMMTRIEALSTVHRRLYQSEDVTRFSVGEFVQDIVTDLVDATGRDDIRVRFELEPVTVPAEKAASLALIVNETATNALKHAFPPGRSGTLTASVERNGSRFRIDLSDDGIEMPEPLPDRKLSFGKDLIGMLARHLRADVNWSPVQPYGTRVVIDLPVERPAFGS